MTKGRCDGQTTRSIQRMAGTHQPARGALREPRPEPLRRRPRLRLAAPPVHLRRDRAHRPRAAYMHRAPRVRHRRHGLEVPRPRGGGRHARPGAARRAPDLRQRHRQPHRGARAPRPRVLPGLRPRPANLGGREGPARGPAQELELPARPGRHLVLEPGMPRDAARPRRDRAGRAARDRHAPPRHRLPRALHPHPPRARRARLGTLRRALRHPARRHHHGPQLHGGRPPEVREHR